VFRHANERVEFSFRGREWNPIVRIQLLRETATEPPRLAKCTRCTVISHDGRQQRAPGIFGLGGCSPIRNSSRHPRAQSEKKGRIFFLPQSDDQKRPACRHRNRQRIPLSDNLHAGRKSRVSPAPRAARRTQWCASSSARGSYSRGTTTPQTFETRNTGVTLEVEPVVGPDGITIGSQLSSTGCRVRRLHQLRQSHQCSGGQHCARHIALLPSSSHGQRD